MSKRIRLFLVSISGLLVFYIVVGGLLGRGNSSDDKTYRNLGVYSEVLSRVSQDYVTEPDLKRATDGAIHGLLEALDPYNTYFSPEEYKEYLRHPDPEPGGVGVFLSKRWGFATVVSVLPGSPAEKAGIKVGDLFDRVDNQPTRELSVVQIERRLAGPVGSTVAVTLVREPSAEPLIVTLTRSALNYPPPIAKIIDGKVGYIRVATFNKGKASEIASKLKELMAGGVDKIVLDLRNCAGGEVEEATRTANLFLDKGIITFISGQHYPRQDVVAEASLRICDLPVAVLINQSTAGAAELVAAAIMENKRGDVVGVRSFGVGVVQKLIPVGDGSGLLLTVAKYYGPGGKAIHDNGVTPNIVESEEDEIAGVEGGGALEPEHFGDEQDQQLRRAIEHLKAKYAPAGAA